MATLAARAVEVKSSVVIGRPHGSSTLKSNSPCDLRGMCGASTTLGSGSSQRRARAPVLQQGTRVKVSARDVAPDKTGNDAKLLGPQPCRSAAESSSPFEPIERLR